MPAQSAELSFPPWLVWPHQTAVTSRDQLTAAFESVSLHRKTRQYVHPLVVILGTPLALFGLGAALATIVGQPAVVVENPTIYVYCIILATALWTIYWLEREGFETLLAIRPAFAVDDSTYYGFMGQFIERLYEPFPWAPRPAGRTVHRPTISAFVIGLFTFILAPTVLVSSEMALIFGVDWPNLSPVLQAYIGVLLVGALVVGIATSWVVVVGAYYMGYRIRTFPIRLDVTQRRNNLGLAPYAQTVLKALVFYLGAYLCATSLVVIRDLNVTFTAGLAIMSLLPVFGFLGSQYGLHRAIEHSKDARLQELRQEFDTEVKQWFLTGEPEPPTDPESDIAQFVMAKNAIEDLPAWPIRVNSVAQLASATVVSNVWVVLQMAGLLG